MDQRPVILHHVDGKVLSLTIDGEALGCERCGIEIGAANGYVHVVDLQNETPYGEQYPKRVRDVGQHFYCSTCGSAAPPSRITYVYYDPESSGTPNDS